MNIDELTVGQAKQLAAQFSIAQQAFSHPWTIGAFYFIRTVTHHYTGKLVQVFAQELVLTDAAWIADDGRFAQAIASAEFAEVEPYPDDAVVIVGRGAVLDATIISHLPRSQK